MGMSYLTIGAFSVETMVLSSLIALMIAKLFLSTACVGLGIPGGLIGPTIVVGACAGVAMGLIGNQIFPNYASSMTFYAVLGLCAMMGATLKAPLAALMAMLELTANPSAILPGMLVIIAASVVTHDLFKSEPLFIQLLRARGLDFKNDPITQTLRRISVAKAMQRNFIEMGRYIHPEAALSALSENPEWVLIKEPEIPTQLMPASDLARALTAEDLGEEIDLLKIPASRRQATSLSLHSNLHQAAEALSKDSTEALYITRITAPLIERTYGILIAEHIESHYQLPYKIRAKSQ
jgi:hypothetical protein